jgi:hypothetical protein
MDRTIFDVAAASRLDASRWHIVRDSVVRATYVNKQQAVVDACQLAMFANELHHQPATVRVLDGFGSVEQEFEFDPRDIARDWRPRLPEAARAPVRTPRFAFARRNAA